MGLSRRDFLKALGASLAAFGTPAATANTLFGAGPSEIKLKDAVAALKDDPGGFLTLLGETYAVHEPDVKLVSAAVSYWVFLGGEVGPLAREARRRRSDGTPVSRLLSRLRGLLLDKGPDAADRFGPPLEHISTVEFHGHVIAAQWAEVPVEDYIDLEKGRGMGRRLVAAYAEKYGALPDLSALAAL